MEHAPYTTQLQAGLGMIPESLTLLRLWQPGMTASQLADTAIREGTFSRTTARRARNLVVEMFAPRFLARGGSAAENLRFLIDHRFPHEALVQLFFLHTARAQRILADFIVEVYWPKYSAGATALTREDAERFVFRGLDTGKMAKRWTDTTIRRISGYLIGCCVDFGLLAGGARGARPIQRFSIRREVALYLAYDLHFSGLGSMGIIQHPDWALFGLEPQEVVSQLKTLSHDGHLLVQSSGELVQISWTYKTMTDCLDALTQRQV